MESEPASRPRRSTLWVGAAVLRGLAVWLWSGSAAAAATQPTAVGDRIVERMSTAAERAGDGTPTKATLQGDRRRLALDEGPYTLSCVCGEWHGERTIAVDTRTEDPLDIELTLRHDDR